MSRTVFFIDGFNLYHAIDNRREFHKFKWLDLSNLAKCFVRKTDSIEDTYYFTALASWAPDKVKRHKIYIKALQIQNVKIIYGEFKRKDKFCPLCRREYRTFEEKQTDVNIAIQLFQLAIADKYDTAIIVSGDSDLIPSITAVQKAFPARKIGIVIPIGRRAEALKQICDFHIKMKEKHLQSSRFQNEIHIGNNQKLVCPANWR